MINRNMQLLFDGLTDAFLTVAATGEVSYANPMSLKALPITIGEHLTVQWLQSQISAIQRG